MRCFAVDRLKERDVASRYYDELVSELHGVQPQAQSLSLDKKCKKLVETIQRVATSTITRKQANKKWFDEKCAEVNEEKNAARERAIQKHKRSQECSQTSLEEREAFIQKKASQLDEVASIEIERHRSIDYYCLTTLNGNTHRSIKALVNFTNAWMTLDDHSNHKWLCVEPRTGNYFPKKKPSSGEMERTFWRTLE
jgi:hypothetical protein